jgi:hypothetical protein
MDHLGSIILAPAPEQVALDRWVKLIASHPHLVPIPPRDGTNPFSGGPFLYPAHPGGVHVKTEGTTIGMMIWAHDGTNRIAVEGNVGLVEQIAAEVASKLGGVYRRGQ